MDKKFEEFKKDRRDVYKPDFAFETCPYWGSNFISKTQDISDEIVEDLVKKIESKMKWLMISKDNIDMLRFVFGKIAVRMVEGLFFLYDKDNDRELRLSYNLLQGGAEFNEHKGKFTTTLRNLSNFVYESIYKPVIYNEYYIVVGFFNKQVNDSLKMILHGIN